MSREGCIVIPAKAGIQKFQAQTNVLKRKKSWILSYAGMTGVPINTKSTDY